MSRKDYFPRNTGKGKTISGDIQGIGVRNPEGKMIRNQLINQNDYIKNKNNYPNTLS